MPDQPEPACLVIADISGYTSYLRMQRPSSAKDRAKLEEMAPFLFHAYADGLAMLAPLIKADVAARSARSVPEPELPVSARRNLVARASS